MQHVKKLEGSSLFGAGSSSLFGIGPAGETAAALGETPHCAFLLCCHCHVSHAPKNKDSRVVVCLASEATASAGPLETDFFCKV